jgi:hypothetical protein
MQAEAGAWQHFRLMLLAARGLLLWSIPVARTLGSSWRWGRRHQDAVLAARDAAGGNRARCVACCAQVHDVVETGTPEGHTFIKLDAGMTEVGERGVRGERSAWPR